MTKEEVIGRIKAYIRNQVNESPENASTINEVLRIAVDAIREQEDRGFGCMSCDAFKKVDANYCPRCGRKLMGGE